MATRTTAAAAARPGPDCVVVGAGINGLLTARELARSGLRVTLLERRRAGQEASWAAGGILSPLYPWRQPAAVTALAAWSQSGYRALAQALSDETGVDPEWTPGGMLVLEAQDAGAALAWSAQHGVVLEPLPETRARALEPALGEAADGALWLPGVAHIRTPRLARAARGSLGRLGVELREGEEVLALEHRGDRVTAVRTARGRLATGRVVVAAGAWSAKLLGDLAPRLAVEPVRGQMILYRVPPGLVSRIVLRGSRYVIPRRDGHLLAGSTVEHAGFDASTTPEALAGIRAAAARLVPALAAARELRQWAGLRPGSPAGVPLIGPHPALRGLWVNTGQFRNGIVLAPASARLLADLLLGRSPVVDPGPYALPAAEGALQPLG